MILRTWHVMIGDFKIGEITHADGGLYVASSNCADDMLHRLETMFLAESAFTKRVPYGARDFVYFERQPDRTVGEGT